MSKDILNNSRDGLRIFQDHFEVDYSLPKWEKVLVKVEQEIHDKLDGKDVISRYSENHVTSIDLGNQIKTIISNQYQETLDLDFFKSLDAEGLTVLINKKKKEQLSKGISNFFIQDLDNAIEIGEPSDVLLSDVLIQSTNRNELGKIPTVNNIVKGKSKFRDKFDKFLEKFKFKKELEKKLDEVKPEETYVMDVLDFFRLVKLESLDETATYLGRLEDYLRAIRNAQQAGQQALVDKLLGNLFIIKYETILKTKGCSKRITEKLLVDFIKKTKKGVSLCYIKNYSRPIPEEVIKKKMEIDGLKVFDNYCILYYDPDKKAYSLTAVENQKERERREDPILFGMIDGVRNLYYITDWVDDTCDLTLDGFVQTLGIKKDILEIENKIKL